MKNKMRNPFVILPFFLLFLIPASFFSQSPQGISFQCLMQNAEGVIMADTPVNIEFKIHNYTPTGEVVYHEAHDLTSNAQGLVTCALGSGISLLGTLGNIDWSNGLKYLQILLTQENIITDLGTESFMNVPYGYYGNGSAVVLRSSGDTLMLGNQSVVVPVVINTNFPEVTSNSGLGSQVLPGNTTCTNQYISVTGCGGQTALAYDGFTYDLVEIGGQCWFADNLATDQYRNGDPILLESGLGYWEAFPFGTYAPYDFDVGNSAIYGNLYNWYATQDNRMLCPTGWHVPTDCEWMFLAGSMGMTVEEQQAEVSLVTPSEWMTNFNVQFSGEFGAGEYVYFFGLGDEGVWWTSSFENGLGIFRSLHGYSFIRAGDSTPVGKSIRCLKD